jgi:hypothetical protein
VVSASHATACRISNLHKITCANKIGVQKRNQDVKIKILAIKYQGAILGKDEVSQNKFC